LKIQKSKIFFVLKTLFGQLKKIRVLASEPKKPKKRQKS